MSHPKKSKPLHPQRPQGEPRNRRADGNDDRQDDHPRRRRQWLVVSYDIEDDRRRERVMKAIAGYGQRAQFSVFECDVRPADVDALEARLRELIEPRVDDVRFYLLCEHCLGKVRLLGKAQRYQRRAFVIV